MHPLLIIVQVNRHPLENGFISANCDSQEIMFLKMTSLLILEVDPRDLRILLQKNDRSTV